MKTLIKTCHVELVKDKNKYYELNSNGTINSPDALAEGFKKVIKLDQLPKEHLVLMTLNTKLKIIGVHIVHIGSIDTSIVHPREIFQMAILDNAATIAIAHNHPSGDPTPSNEDVNVTKRVAEAGKLLGIGLIDHIIIGDDRHVSLKEKGYC